MFVRSSNASQNKQQQFRLKFSFFLFPMYGAEIKSPFKDDNSSVLCIYFFIINRQTLPLLSVLCVYFYVCVCTQKMVRKFFSSLSSFSISFLRLCTPSHKKSFLHFLYHVAVYSSVFCSFAHNGKNLLSDS